MTAIIFIDAGVILDNGGGPSVRPADGCMGPDAGVAMQFRWSGSADGVNALAARLGAPIVVHDAWGLADPLAALRASGVTAAAHTTPRVDMRPLTHLAAGHPQFVGDWSGRELPPVTISLRPPAPDPSPLFRWMRQHGGGARPILIAAANTVNDTPGLILVTVKPPAHLGMDSVGTIVAAVERGR